MLPYFTSISTPAAGPPNGHRNNIAINRGESNNIAIKDGTPRPRLAQNIADTSSPRCTSTRPSSTRAAAWNVKALM